MCVKAYESILIKPFNSLKLSIAPSSVPSEWQFSLWCGEIPAICPWLWEEPGETLGLMSWAVGNLSEERTLYYEFAVEAFLFLWELWPNQLREGKQATNFLPPMQSRCRLISSSRDEPLVMFYILSFKVFAYYGVPHTGTDG